MAFGTANKYYQLNWVKESIQPSVADKLNHYGYQFWLNGYDQKDPTKHLVS
jgi:hypothetical protein